MARRRMHRGLRPDGTYEVWIDGDPFHGIAGLGRLRSWLVVAVAWLAQAPTKAHQSEREA